LVSIRLQKSDLDAGEENLEEARADDHMHRHPQNVEHYRT